MRFESMMKWKLCPILIISIMICCVGCSQLHAISIAKANIVNTNWSLVQNIDDNQTHITDDYISIVKNADGYPLYRADTQFGYILLSIHEEVETAISAGFCFLPIIPLFLDMNRENEINFKISMHTTSEAKFDPCEIAINLPNGLTFHPQMIKVSRREPEKTIEFYCCEITTTKDNDTNCISIDKIDLHQDLSGADLSYRYKTGYDLKEFTITFGKISVGKENITLSPLKFAPTYDHLKYFPVTH